MEINVVSDIIKNTYLIQISKRRVTPTDALCYRNDIYRVSVIKETLFMDVFSSHIEQSQTCLLM